MAEGLRITRLLLAWPVLLLLTLFLYLGGVITLRWASATPHWYVRLFHFWSRLWVWALGVDLRLIEQNSKPLPEQYILIANHPSAFEDVGIPALFDVRSLAKQEVAHWFIVGLIGRAAGTLFVQRENRESRQQAFGQLLNVLEEGDNIAIYPEGGVKGKRLHTQFQFGAFRASLASGVAIVPILIHYHDEEAFYWDRESLPQKLLQILFARSHRADYHIFDAFDPADFADHQAFADHVHQCYLQWQKSIMQAQK